MVRGRFAKRFHLNYSKKRTLLWIFTGLLLLMLYFFKNASTLLRVTSAITTMVLFYFIDRVFDVRFKKRHYAFMLIIVIASFIGSPLYFSYPNYDKVQHFFQPILACSLIFHMVRKLHLELKWKIVFTFFVVVAILGLFEIGEYTLDLLFNLKLQGVYLRDINGIEKFNLLLDPLSDTMIDLVYGVLGSLLYCGTLAIKYRKKLMWNLWR